ncbi:unnamed protein product [Bemisia tabaci]|uniref:Death-associated protein 1 n=1 Tax=Bemisia tabaci TaxID=7038 RepID=A0A9P0F5A1_BEMTA|nr:unnamed protein product [Bemisia tabaci]
MSTSEEKECKAGHPPAQKAGAMRITQHKGSSHHKEGEVPDIDKNSVFKVSISPPKSSTVVSGVPIQKVSDQPVEAIQSYHEKQLPTRDAHSAHAPKPVIHQPRK